LGRGGAVAIGGPQGWVLGHTIKVRHLTIRYQSVATMPAVPAPIGLHLQRTARVVGQAFERAMQDAGGSASTWQVLLSIRGREWGAQAKIAAAMGITGATLTHHLNALESQGLVRRWREEGNRRVQRVELTPEGDALVERLRGVAMAFDARLRGALTEAELAEAGRLLDALAGAVGPGEDAGGEAAL